MNVKTIVTIALIGLLGVGTAAGIFLSDRSQQQEPPSADVQQEEKEEAPVESSSQKEEQEQSSQDKTAKQLAEEFAKEKEEYYLLLPMPKTRCRRTGSIQTEEVQNGYEMDKRAAPAMREMIQAAKEDGVELMLCSAYRSVEKQKQLFDRSQQAYMAQGMSEEEAYAKTATETAIPGTSEHQTGLAADIVTLTYQYSMQALQTRQPVSSSANTRQSTASCCATRRTSRKSPASSTSRGITALSARPTPN